MVISQNGEFFIKQNEGFREFPYNTDGTPTIGYGTTIYPDGTKVKMTDRGITEAEGLLYMRHHFSLILPTMNRLITAKINQNQFDSLCDFVYNVGINAFKDSTLLKRVNFYPQDWIGIQDAFNMWIYSSDETCQGLINRRIKEFELYRKN
jgi:lysozyme